MRTHFALALVCLTAVCLLTSGCIRPEPSPEALGNTPPVEPSNAPTASGKISTSTQLALSPDQIPSNRKQFESWVRKTSPHAPINDDETQAVAALEQWLRDECEMKDLVLLPAPHWESGQMPERYHEWYEEDELAVYLWEKRELPDLRIVVGPPEACGWCTAEMAKEDGQWVLLKATDSPDSPEDQVIYQRGLGFLPDDEDDS